MRRSPPPTPQRRTGLQEKCCCLCPHILLATAVVHGVRAVAAVAYGILMASAELLNQHLLGDALSLI